MQYTSQAIYEESLQVDENKKLLLKIGEVFRRLARQKESEIEEGHLMPDHVHMMISIPPKYAVSQVIGFIKGKSAIDIARM